MLWLQACLSFILWIAAGIWLGKRPALWIAQQTRAQRILLATTCLFGSIVALLAGFGLGYTLGGLLPDRMTPVGWLGVTLGGIGFVACQAFAARLLLEVLRDGQ